MFPTHTPLLRMYPASHALPQLVPLQVACAWGSFGVGHGVQLVPHELTLLSETQVLLQTCVPVPQAAQVLAGQ